MEALIVVFVWSAAWLSVAAAYCGICEYIEDKEDSSDVHRASGGDMLETIGKIVALATSLASVVISIAGAIITGKKEKRKWKNDKQVGNRKV